jgi:hypothetical protein
MVLAAIFRGGRSGPSGTEMENAAIPSTAASDERIEPMSNSVRESEGWTATQDPATAATSASTHGGGKYSIGQEFKADRWTIGVSGAEWATQMTGNGGYIQHPTYYFFVVSIAARNDGTAASRLQPFFLIDRREASTA